MKKALLLTALAAAAMTVTAKDASDLRIYINPGHGGWSANDRPLPLVNVPEWTDINPDTLGFFESNTNLWKGFGLLEELVKYGFPFDRTLNQTGKNGTTGAARDMSNHLVMSRVKNGPYHPGIAHNQNVVAAQSWEDPTQAENQYTYNRNLSEIDAEVDANNFDMFISIHSNALAEGTTTTYPLYIYRGFDSPQLPPAGTCPVELQETSRAMAIASWPYAIANTHQMWTSYTKSMNVRGDCNFYAGPEANSKGYYGYLGVLKHSVPGFLVEGYFHTYQPARHRAMNPEVCYVEGSAYARGVADYFGLTKSGKGTIYLVLRDQHEKLTHKYYKPNPNTKDVYLPLNGATVVLKDKDGNVVATKTTDNYYNGTAVFMGVEPGNYTVEISCPEYKAVEPLAVTVKADADVYPTVDLENVAYEPPAITYVNYPDPVQTEAIKAADEYKFSIDYTAEIPALNGKYIKRTIYNNGLVYILGLSNKHTNDEIYADQTLKPEATLVVFNPATKEVTEVSTEGTYGLLANVYDIQVTADGYLLASNWTKTQYSADQVEAGDVRGTYYIYKWAKGENGLPEGNPEVFLTTQNAGRWYRAYPGNFCYTGKIDEGKAFIFMPTITAPHRLRSTCIPVVNGQQGTQSDILGPRETEGASTYLPEADFGQFNMVTSPIDDDIFYVTTENKGVYEMTYAMNDADSFTANVDINGAKVGAFKYAGANYLTIADDNAVSLYNVDNGLKAATEVITSVKGAASTQSISEEDNTFVAVDGTAMVALDDKDNITDAWIDVYAVNPDGTISKYTTKGNDTVNRKEYAYDLKIVETNEDSYTLGYTLTGDVKSAEFVITDFIQAVDSEVTPEGKEGFAIALDGITAGQHTFTIERNRLEADIYSRWAIRTHSKAVAKAGEYFADDNNLEVRGGVVVITDPEQDSYGYVSVGHGKNQGIDVYAPNGEKVATRVHKNDPLFQAGTTNQSNPIRGTERAGKVLFGSWGDGACGIVAFDPKDPEADMQGMFAGTKTGSGCYQYEGVNLGGGTAGIAFVQTGETADDGIIYSFSEDHENQNGSGSTENTIVAYEIGTAWQITKAPRIIGFKSTLANTNVDLVTAGNGFLASQVRGAGNNAESVPGFIYLSLDADEDVTFNSGTLNDEEYGMLSECNSAVAMTTDLKLLAAAESGRVLVYDVEWNNDTPKLTYKYAFATPTVGWGTMRFDPAGNLHYYQREQGGYHAYALPEANPVTTTPAKYFDSLSANLSGVDNITVNNDNAAPAVYYNLNGVRMSGNLVPGIYIKRQGATSTKVIVR